ncbi:MAG: lipopolysaccharide biosynthesis protein [Spirosomataceae bacterium]|jgi:lipopolysaccharide biosynthesis protein
MKKLCIFVHYSNFNYVPYYVLRYVKELTKFFDEIVIVTNVREISNTSEFLSNEVRLMQVKNEGYDLGMFLKVYETIDLSEYEQIGCLNDSNILLQSLDFLFNWAKDNPADLWGLIDADICPSYSTHDSNFHVQSHFIVFNRSSFSTLKSFIERLNLAEMLKIEQIKGLKRKVINDWEIGLSQYFIKNGLIVRGYFHANEYFWDGTDSPSHVKMLEAGIPVIKKKVITSVKPRDLFSGKNYWSSLVKKYARDIVDSNILLPELQRIRRQYLKEAATQFLKKPFA